MPKIHYIFGDRPHPHGDYLTLDLVMALCSLLTLHHNYEDPNAVSSKQQHGAQLLDGPIRTYLSTYAPCAITALARRAVLLSWSLVNLDLHVQA